MTTNEMQALIEKTSRLCHEVNKAYCEALGDTSQPSWENAPEWQKNSARNGVAFHIANPKAGRGRWPLAHRPANGLERLHAHSRW